MSLVQLDQKIMAEIDNLVKYDIYGADVLTNLNKNVNRSSAKKTLTSSS